MFWISSQFWQGRFFSISEWAGTPFQAATEHTHLIPDGLGYDKLGLQVIQKATPGGGVPLFQVLSTMPPVKGMHPAPGEWCYSESGVAECSPNIAAHAWGLLKKKQSIQCTHAAPVFSALLLPLIKQTIQAWKRAYETHITSMSGWPTYRW